MNSLTLKFFKMVFSVIAVISGILLMLLIILTITEYTPASSEDLKPNHANGKKIINKPEISLMIWNIGYAGLGKEMDFFYDGGQMVRPNEMLFNSWQKSILNYVKANDSIDFILLQEVDQNSKRSYFSTQTQLLAESLQGHNAVFAKNYDAPFVPLPLTNPMGKVVSGLMSFSAFQSEESMRVAFQGNYSWPKRLFMLKRCFIIQRFKTSFDGDLVVINTHNSAFDDGSLREEQINVLKSFATMEFEKGNYVIVAGDWNMNPPGYDPKSISNGSVGVLNPLGIEPDFMPPGWLWAFDPLIPTNRYLDRPYFKGVTKTTIIDFFLVSPNISVLTTKSIDLGFEFSDHNPIILKISLQR